MMANDKTPGFMRTALRALAVAGALLAALVYTSLVFQPKTNNSEFGLFDAGTSGIAAEPKDTIDVVVVGDSVALNSFDPRQFWNENGFALYVCSSLAQKLPDGHTMLRNALENQSPKVVLIEVHPVFTEFTWDFALLNELQHYLPILRYHSRWRVLKPVDFTLTHQDTWIDPNKGARIESAIDAVEDDEINGYMEETSKTETLDPQNALYLQRMVDLCVESGATPVLVSVPSVVDWSTERHNAIDAWAKEHGVAYHDFNLKTDEMGLDWTTDSKDGGNHLNASGAQKLTRYVGALLDSEYDLPDHRQDEAYASWNQL